MNREILFRGKRLDNGQWVYGNYNYVNGKAYIFPEDAPDSYDNYQVDPTTVGQFTGLLDKNGKGFSRVTLLSVCHGMSFSLTQRPAMLWSLFVERWRWCLWLVLLSWLSICHHRVKIIFGI